jgi:hypothetical protein
MFILDIHADTSLGEAIRSQTMADSQPRDASCMSFLIHSLHIPRRNLGIFAPVFALNVAYVGFADHAYSLAQDGVLRPNDMAAAYLLCAFLGPASGSSPPPWPSRRTQSQSSRHRRGVGSLLRRCAVA